MPDSPSNSPTPTAFTLPHTGPIPSDGMTGQCDAGHSTGPSGANFPSTESQTVRKLQACERQARDFPELLARIAAVIEAESDCLGLWGLPIDGPSKTSEASASSSKLADPVPIMVPDDQLWSLLESRAQILVADAQRWQTVVAATVDQAQPIQLVVAPLVDTIIGKGRHGAQMVLLACFETGRQSDLRQQWLIALAAQTIDLWHQRQQNTQQRIRSTTLSDSFAMIEALNGTQSTAEAARVLVNHLQRLANCQQVTLAVGPAAERLRIEATSGVEEINLSVTAAKTMVAACQQPMIAKRPLFFTAGMTSGEAHEIAFRDYLRLAGVTGCAALPLEDRQGNRIGTILVGCDSDQVDHDNYRDYLIQVVAMLSGYLAVVLRANAGWKEKLRSSAQRIKKAKWTKPISFGLLAVLALMMLPLPYRVSCDCELQPILRRFIAAPHEGILETTLVESGDMVQAGQIIARLDGDQLRLEITSLKADLEGARKRRDSALANRDIAQSQIARSEMKRHEAKIQLLKQRMENLEVRTPIQGMVVSGDLEKAHGAPVEMGQTLFEIAPLEKMVAEVAIPETEIRFIEPGQQVALKLNSLPFESLHGTIERIHPRAEVIDGVTVYIAEVTLPNGETRLKPGMKRTAKVATGLAPLGWNLFHRPWESVRYWSVW